MEDFNGPMEEEVPCADYHVQASAVSFFGGVYLKFKFSDLQSRHPILKNSDSSTGIKHENF